MPVEINVLIPGKNVGKRANPEANRRGNFAALL
jgi:hypothetical protein